MTDLYNIDAEQAVLGAVLFENEILDEMAWLKPIHFHDPVHGRIFETASRLIERGEHVDPVLLKTHFDNDEGLEDIGGAKYLSVLASVAVPGLAAAAYAKQVYSLAICRGVVKASEEAKWLAEGSPEIEASDLLNSVDQIFADLSDDVGVGGELAEPVSGFEQVWEDARIAHETGVVAGTATGLASIDRLLGSMMGGDLIVLGGRPSMGKTALAVNIAKRVAETGKKVGFTSVEMTKGQIWQRLIVEAAARADWLIRLDDFKTGKFNSDADHRGGFEAASDLSLRLRGNFVVDDSSSVTISDIGRQARRMKREMGGLDLLIVDYLGLIQSDGKRRDGNKTQEVSDITSGLKRLAKDLGIPIVLLSQLSRNLESRDDKRPRLSDLRDSGSIEQDADVVMFVYREAYYMEREAPREGTPEHSAWQEEFFAIADLMEVIIAKQRQGAIGTAKLTFRGESMRIDDRVAS